MQSYKHGSYNFILRENLKLDELNGNHPEESSSPPPNSNYAGALPPLPTPAKSNKSTSTPTVSTDSTPTKSEDYDESPLPEISDIDVFSSTPKTKNHLTDYEKFHQDTLLEDNRSPLHDVDNEGNEIRSSGSSTQSSTVASRRLPCCDMRRLRHQIALEKAKLMKNLELNCDKSILDSGITVLQELQLQYVRFERDNQNGDGTCSCLSHDDDMMEHMTSVGDSYYSSMHNFPSLSRSLPSFGKYGVK